MVQLFCIETKGSIWIPHVSRQPTQSGCHYHSYHFAEAFFQGPARNRRRRVLHDFVLINFVEGASRRRSSIVPPINTREIVAWFTPAFLPSWFIDPAFVTNARCPRNRHAAEADAATNASRQIDCSLSSIRGFFHWQFDTTTPSS